MRWSRCGRLWADVLPPFTGHELLILKDVSCFSKSQRNQMKCLFHLDAAGEKNLQVRAIKSEEHQARRKDNRKIRFFFGISQHRDANEGGEPGVMPGNDVNFQFKLTVPLC